MTFTITLSDGTKLEGLKLNGNNFISLVPIKPEDLIGKLSPVKVDVMLLEDEKPEPIFFPELLGEHAHMKLVSCREYQGEWWFILEELSRQELKEKEVDARLSYLEMITEE